MTALLAWAFSSIGRKVLQWVGIAAVALGVIWKIYDSGKDAARTEQQKRDIEALRERNTINDTVSKTPDGDLRDELSRWVRD